MTHTTFFKALKKIRAFCFIIWGGPSLDRILHGNLINKDCVKIQVDIIIEGYEKMPVIDVTRTDEIMFVGDMLHQFIQWPRHALKLVNNEAMSTSSSSQRGTTRNVSSLCSSYRVDSPQTHNNDSSSSSYQPLQDEDFNSIAPQVPSEYELGPMGFMNLWSLVGIHYISFKAPRVKDVRSQLEKEMKVRQNLENLLEQMEREAEKERVEREKLQKQMEKEAEKDRIKREKLQKQWKRKRKK
ncbi:hypothetical protein R6Q59_006159 [Mikania micrantha]